MPRNRKCLKQILISRMNFYLFFWFVLHYSLKLHNYCLVKYYCGRQLNDKWMNARQVVTGSFVAWPHSKWRNKNNNYYCRTTIAFHGFIAGNFWRSKNAQTASNIPNLCHAFIIQLLRLLFSALEFWDSQLKTLFWAIKLSKNQRKKWIILTVSPFAKSLPRVSMDHKHEDK